jgi:hypothetical protein
MKNLLVTTLIVAATPALLTAAEPVDELNIYYIPNAVPSHGLFVARGITTAILADAGIKLRWYKGAPPASVSELRNTFRIEFLTKAPATSSSHGLASSFPYRPGAALITVYNDRLAPYFEVSAIQGAAILGHVLAHEIGHSLQGIARHSDTGVMKARWTPAEVRNMAVERLKFTEEDIYFLREGLQVRLKAGASQTASAARH